MEALQEIFQPLIKDIQKLINDQVNLVIIKRLREGHPKAKEIKVSLTYERSNYDQVVCSYTL